MGRLLTVGLILVLFLCNNLLALIPIPYSFKSSQNNELPNFGTQNKAIGYSHDSTFKVPHPLRERVDFWKKIYIELSSSQAIIHDSQYPEITYKVLDISAYTENNLASYPRRMAALDQFFKNEKEHIARQLKQLHGYRGSVIQLPVELQLLQMKFKNVKEKNKYLNAVSRLRAQVGQREYVVKGFVYGGRYFNQMMKIFESYNLPKELTRLPLVESAFNLDAKSKVGASGIWQFMPLTGKQYLKIDANIDERNDPIAATKAAARLLKENYEALGSWPLAITAYNHGRQGVLRAVTATGSNHLHHIIKHHKAPSFGFASQNFYSEFLAILELEKDYKKHFGKMLVAPPLEFEIVKVLKNSSISNVSSRCKLDSSIIAEFNPALTDWTLKGKGIIPKGFHLKIPRGSAQFCAQKNPSIVEKRKSSPAQIADFKLHSKS